MFTSSEKFHEGPARPRWGLRIFVAAALLAVMLLAPRAYVMQQSGFETWARIREPIKYVVKLILSGTYDSAYVLGLAFVFAVVLLVPLSRFKRGGWIVYSVFLAAAAGSVVASVMNTEVVKTLGRPFNYQWLYYSDFLKSTDSHQAMMASLSWKIVSAIVSACLAYVLISVFAGRFVDRFVSRRPTLPWKLVAIGLIVAAIGYVAVGHRYLMSRGWPYEKLANPVYVFAHSAVASHSPPLFTMKTPFGEEDFAPPRAAPESTLPATRPAIRHVVLFVLESTPAEYLGAYGSKYAVTPNLDKWARHAAVFENVYAHAPATNKSLFSLLYSAYPWISFKAETEEKPDIALPSIVEQLEEQTGATSGFFYSGDLSFQGAGEFAHHAGFDVLEDYTQRKSTRKIFTNDKWPFLNGSDDVSTVESLVRWLGDQQAKGKPTFTMLWTNMTHYPYFTEADTHDFGPKEHLFNTYLNALHVGDRGFGVLMQFLQSKQMLDETLVVVVGDHGEAFMRHDQLSHGNKIYEENCHVPLLLINPKLFNGERYATVGGVADVAPTITDVIGKPAGATWQGRSLFDKGRPNRTYFFAPWSDYLFGYREGDTKFIYNASKDRYEMYDLSTDPTEQKNLISGASGHEIEKHLQRIAAWVQYQKRMFDRLLATP